MHDLKSRLNAATYIYNPPQTPPLIRRGLLLPYGNPAVAGVDSWDQEVIVTDETQVPFVLWHLD